MPKEDQKTTFIVTTSSAHGAWYPEKKSTLSLINSHVANRKAQQASLRRAQSSKAVRQARPRKRTSVDQSDLLIEKNEPQSEAELLSNVQPNARNGWSLEELEDIFGEQGKSEADPPSLVTKLHHGQRINTLPTTSSIQSAPTLGRTGSYPTTQVRQQQAQQSFGDELRPIIWDHASRTQESVLRLPHRAAAQSLINRGHQDAASLRDPSQQQIAAYTTSAPPTISKQIESILDPFLRLSIKVSTHEQQLLHFCMLIRRVSYKVLTLIRPYRRETNSLWHISKSRVLPSTPSCRQRPPPKEPCLC